MAAKCCNKTVWHIGTFSSCGNIDTGMITDINIQGYHSLHFKFKGIEHKILLNLESLEPIIIPNVFAEDAFTEFTIVRPNGELYIFKRYNCATMVCEKYTKFSLRTVPFIEHIEEETIEGNRLQTC